MITITNITVCYSYQGTELPHPLHAAPHLRELQHPVVHGQGVGLAAQERAKIRKHMSPMGMLL